MQRAIFISYRRDDSEGEAGRLYDDLVRVFGADALFMDVSDIHPGKDFRQAIDDNVAKCAVLLAIIGPGWTTIKDASGVRRLDQPNDFVRLEITSALTRGMDVIPVLVHGSRMPNPAELPESLQNLAYRNGVELTHARWNSDVEVLSRALREYVHRGDTFATRAIHKAITGENAVVGATPREPEEALKPSKAPARYARIAAGVLALVASAMAGASAYVYIHHQLKHRAKEESKAPTESTEKAAPPAPSEGAAVPVSASSQAAAPIVPAEQRANASTPTTSDTATTANQEHLQALSGDWINPHPQEGKPARVEIGAQGDQASVHLWTQCGTSSCDLGTKSTALAGAGITIQWSGEFRNAGNEQMASQTVKMRMYRLGSGLHMIYSETPSGSTGFDFVRNK